MLGLFFQKIIDFFIKCFYQLSN